MMGTTCDMIRDTWMMRGHDYSFGEIVLFDWDFWQDGHCGIGWDTSIKARKHGGKG